MVGGHTVPNFISCIYKQTLHLILWNTETCTHDVSSSHHTPKKKRKKGKSKNQNTNLSVSIWNTICVERVFLQIYISNSWLNYSINCLQVEEKEWVSCSASQIRKITVSQTVHTPMSAVHKTGSPRFYLHTGVHLSSGGIFELIS